MADETLSEFVWERARARCEYCQLPQVLSYLPFEIDHVIAKKHRGKTAASNLALSCVYCNSYKGANIAGIDPRGGRLTAIFHPRRHKWSRHFLWDGPRLVGRTPVGRTTIAVLAINHPDTVALRQALIEEGAFPPE